MHNKEILERLEAFTEAAIKKIHDAGLSYLFNTKITKQGLKIGCVLIMHKNDHHHLYDLTKRCYIQEKLINRKIAITAAINYNRGKNITMLLNMDNELQSLMFEKVHFKQLRNNARSNNDEFRVSLYETHLQNNEMQILTLNNAIEYQFENASLDK